MVRRSGVRIVPRSPITVAIEEDSVLTAYGAVANISEAGACIWTDADLDAGDGVILRLSFPRGSQPLLARGVVIWRDGGRGPRRLGLRWTDESAARRRRLERSQLISA
jgi:hypothetical protein